MTVASPELHGPATGGQGAEVIADAVTRTYPGGVRALDDVTLRIAAGEFAAVTGPSGSGKSTLLNVLGSLDRPQQGRVLVGGEDLGALRDVALYRRSTVGFVFQLHHLLPMLSAQMNVEVPLIGIGVPARERRERARRMLHEVGLARPPEAMPSELSGGERQMVAVARALINRPALLLADEPTGSLDRDARDRVLALLRDLQARHGMTIVMVTHDPPDPALIDRLVEIRGGRVVADDQTAGFPRCAEPPGGGPSGHAHYP